MHRKRLHTAVRSAGAAVVACCFLLLALSPRALGDLLVRDHLPPGFWTTERLSRARCIGSVFAVLWLVYTVSLLRSSGGDERAGTKSGAGVEPSTGDIRAHVVAILVLLAASFLVRVRFLAVPLDYDEAYTLLNYARHGPVEALARFDSTNNHPLNSLLMAIAYRWGGPSEWVVRLPVFLAGVLVPVLVYVACAAFREPVAGFCAGAVAVVSMPMVEYSVNARGYMLLAFANLLATLGAGRLLRGHSSTGLLNAGMVLGIWSMPSALLAFPGMVGWIWRRTRSWSHVVQLGLGVAAVGGLIYVPGYIAMGTRALENPFVLPLEPRVWLARYPLALAEGLGAVAVPVPYDGIAARMRDGTLQLTGRWLMHPEAVGCVLVAVLVVGSAVLARGALTSWAAAVLVSVALACGGLRLAPPPRVFAPYIPFVVMLVAVGLVRTIGERRDPLPGKCPLSRRTLVAAALFLLGLGLVFYGRRPLASRLDRYGWRLYVPAAAERIAERSGGRECCVVAALPADLPLRFYLWRAGVPYRWGVDGPCEGGRYLVWLSSEPVSGAALLADPVLKPFASTLGARGMRAAGYLGPLVLYEIGCSGSLPADPER